MVVMGLARGNRLARIMGVLAALALLGAWGCRDRKQRASGEEDAKASSGAQGESGQEGHTGSTLINFKMVETSSPEGGRAQKVWEFLSIPSGQAPGAYSTTYYYQAVAQ